MMMIILMVVVSGGISCLALGLVLMQGDFLNSTGYSTYDYAESPEYGYSGDRDFGAVCSENEYAKKILLSTKAVGPHVANKRHDRIHKLGVLCSKGGKQFGVGKSSDMKTEVGCGKKKPIGFRAWTTKDALQRLEPVCDGYGQYDASGDKKLGSSIGDNRKYECPNNQYLAGFSGSYSDGHLNSIIGHCRRIN